jgi:hypothetical protein
MNYMQVYLVPVLVVMADALPREASVEVEIMAVTNRFKIAQENEFEYINTCSAHNNESADKADTISLEQSVHNWSIWKNNINITKTMELPYICKMSYVTFRNAFVIGNATITASKNLLIDPFMVCDMLLKNISSILESKQSSNFSLKNLTLYIPSDHVELSTMYMAIAASCQRYLGIDICPVVILSSNSMSHINCDVHINTVISSYYCNTILCHFLFIDIYQMNSEMWIEDMR